MIINLEHIPEASKICREKSHIRILTFISFFRIIVYLIFDIWRKISLYLTLFC